MPLAVILAEPVLSPLHKGEVCVTAVMFGPGLLLIAITFVCMHPLVSVTESV